MDNNGHSSGVPFKGTCQPFPASNIVLPKTGVDPSCLSCSLAGMLLTAKLLFKIQNGD